MSQSLGWAQFQRCRVQRACAGSVARAPLWLCDLKMQNNDKGTWMPKLKGRMVPGLVHLQQPPGETRKMSPTWLLPQSADDSPRGHVLKHSHLHLPGLWWQGSLEKTQTMPNPQRQPGYFYMLNLSTAQQWMHLYTCYFVHAWVILRQLGVHFCLEDTAYASPVGGDREVMDAYYVALLVGGYGWRHWYKLRHCCA